MFIQDYGYGIINEHAYYKVQTYRRDCFKMGFCKYNEKSKDRDDGVLYEAERRQDSPI
ncbi:MAG TPA: hypothetical protein IAD32_02415 [Candidatus Scatavimonas merdigallinarum]|uniref:Uncharacterized protein n=1 Tax=Candidatus Scatavimonas merdigallinarum TaxID=2840914 RepID=A0A9D0ZGY8_9FIRM|nr:hypothetical protein [Candidatus Scatavimonas merdigallinarum]